MDWLDQTRRGRMRAYMVSPTKMDMIIDEITGVDWSASSISCGYYTTTRTSASLKTVGGNWKRNTFVRLVYEVPEWGYSQELGTYLVSNDNADRHNNVWETTLELHSMLFALDKEIAPESILVQPDTSVFTPMRNELDLARREHIFVSPRDFRFTKPTVFEGGNSRLSRLSALCSMSDNRIDVNGHGLVTISPYIAPAAKSASIHLSLLDKRGIVFDDVSRTTNWLEIPNQAAVRYKFSTTNENGDTYDDEITAIVYANAYAPNGANNRGYNITHYEEITDMQPATHARAQEIAAANLAKNSREKVEWTLRTKFLPVWEGSVITLDIPDGLAEYRGRRHCLVKSVDLTGPYWDMSLTLKETASGDEED